MVACRGPCCSRLPMPHGAPKPAGQPILSRFTGQGCGGGRARRAWAESPGRLRRRLVTAGVDFADRVGGDGAYDGGQGRPGRDIDAGETDGNAPVLAGWGPSLRLTAPRGGDTIVRRWGGSSS